MLVKSARCLARRDPRAATLSKGSSMVLGSKGMAKSTLPHRTRMPWTEAREYLPFRVLSRKDSAILEGKHIQEPDSIDRMSQRDPLEVLEAAVAQYRYSTSNGKNLFQLASQCKFHGRGQRFYRADWREGTYDKFVTLSAVTFDRDGNGGKALGYVTFHGETTLKPIEIDYAEFPGWFMEYDESRAVAEAEIVTPPPSIGTEVPVDPKTYKLKAYPFYDPPNPPEFVERLLKDRGVLPDPPIDESAEATSVDDGDVGDGSVKHTGV